MLILAVSLAFGFAGGSIWSNKGGSFGAGFAIGLLLGVIGLVIVAVAEPSGSGGTSAPTPPRWMSTRPNIPTVESDGSLHCARCGRHNPAGRTACIGCGSGFSLPVRPPVPPAPAPDLTAELERLVALHRGGDLSQQEFDEAKAKLLAP